MYVYTRAHTHAVFQATVCMNHSISMRERSLQVIADTGCSKLGLGGVRGGDWVRWGGVGLGWDWERERARAHQVPEKKAIRTSKGH